MIKIYQKKDINWKRIKPGFKFKYRRQNYNFISKRYRNFNRNDTKQEVYEIRSIFSSGLYEFDRNVAFLNIKDLENLFETDVSTRSLEIYLNEPENIEFQKK